MRLPRPAPAPASGTGHVDRRVELDTRGVGADIMGQGVHMAREIPVLVRAAAGLAATALDEARKLPETLPGLPVRIIGVAMQHAMKVQQHYAGLVARGDELFTGLRGENEPGLATFDDEEPVAEHTGFRDSAFDRAEVAAPTADLLADEERVAGTSPDTEEILDQIAIDQLVDQAPTLEETAPGPARAAKKAATAPARKAAKKAAQKAEQEAGAAKPPEAAAETPTDSGTAPLTGETLDAEPTADVATTVDVLTPAGEVASVEATVTDGGVAAPESPADGGSAALRTAPVDGYDSFTVAQLRGRLRGYALNTVQDLVSYEEATRARAPYLTMLRNRLEKLEEQAIESSPFAPRGA
jgi:hypothetical protein